MMDTVGLKKDMKGGGYLEGGREPTREVRERKGVMGLNIIKCMQMS